MEFYKNCSEKKKRDQSDKRKWRIVIDYHRLNDWALSDKYPLSQLYELLDKLGRARPFTISDLEARFLKIEINIDDIPKNTYSNLNGHYEIIQMPFRLKGGSATS